jgi:hypothetical protein
MLLIYDVLSRLSRVRFTLGYMAIVAVVSFAILTLDPHTHELVVQQASTNLHNLAHGHLRTLLDSAFVVEAGPVYFWMPFLACLLALAELQLHSIRLMVAFVVGHIGATLVVVGALAAAVEFGWLPMSISRASDVGMSYGALAVLGALTAAIPSRWRPAWVGWWISAALAAGVVGGDFTGAGHAVAVILGVLVSAQFRQPIHWTPVRLAMLVGSSGFGFLLLAQHWDTMGAALAFGLVGAFLAHKAAYKLGRPSMQGDASTTETPVVPQPV